MSSRQVIDVQIKGYHLVVLHNLAMAPIAENWIAHLGRKIGYYNENFIHAYYIIKYIHVI
jgi:hypothetical protein